MTLQQLQTKANAKLADFWTALQARQNSFFSTHNKYFQLLATNTVVDGEDTDFEVRIPSEGLNSLIDPGFSFSSKIPFQIQVDEWVDHDGNKGYSATAVVELLNGDAYTRTRHSNNDDTGWSKVVLD